MGKKKADKSSSNKNNTLNNNSSQNAMNPNELETLLRKQLVQNELSQSNIENDVKSLEYPAIDFSYIKNAQDIFPLEQICNNNEISYIEKTQIVKNQILEMINSIKSTKSNSELIINECVGLLYEKHNFLQEIKVKSNENQKQLEITSKLTEINKLHQKTIKAINEQIQIIEDEEKMRIIHANLKFKESVDDISKKFKLEDERQKKIGEENSSLRHQMAEFQTKSDSHISSWKPQMLSREIEFEAAIKQTNSIEATLEEETKQTEEMRLKLIEEQKLENELHEKIESFNSKFEGYGKSLSENVTKYQKSEEKAKTVTKLIKSLEKDIITTQNSIIDSDSKIKQFLLYENENNMLINDKSKMEIYCRDLQKELKEISNKYNMPIPKIDSTLLAQYMDNIPSQNPKMNEIMHSNNVETTNSTTSSSSRKINNDTSLNNDITNNNNSTITHNNKTKPIIKYNHYKKLLHKQTAKTNSTEVLVSKMMQQLMIAYNEICLYEKELLK